MEFCFTLCSMINNKMPTKSDNLEVELHEEAKHSCSINGYWLIKKVYLSRWYIQAQKTETYTYKLNYILVNSKVNKLVKLNLFSDYALQQLAKYQEGSTAKNAMLKIFNCQVMPIMNCYSNESHHSSNSN